MYLLPGLYYGSDTTYLEKPEAIIVALVAYLSTAQFIGLLIFCCFNVWVYLIKEQKWKVFPLSAFYSLALVTLAMRIIDSIWVVHNFFTQQTFFILFPPVLKQAIGIVQVMIMTELSVRVSQSMTIMQA